MEWKEMVDVQPLQELKLMLAKAKRTRKRGLFFGVNGNVQVVRRRLIIAYLEWKIAERELLGKGD